jgi:glycine/D-amino acid oxidase-like deaminating enzyme
VRLERFVHGGREVIACYGHGGAGVTLSWGCAEDVVRLVDASPLRGDDAVPRRLRAGLAG